MKIYRKIISLLIISAIFMVNADIFKTFPDDRIYDTIKIVLKKKYPDEDEKVDCMVDYYRTNKIADKFYSVDLIGNHDKLLTNLEPYIDEAELNCNEVLKFFKSPLGLGVIAITSLILLIIIVSVFVHCIKRKRHSVSFNS